MGYGASSSDPAVSSSLSLLYRKLAFFISFVRDRMAAAELRAWNRALYQEWQTRFEEHEEMHTHTTAGLAVASAVSAPV